MDEYTGASRGTSSPAGQPSPLSGSGSSPPQAGLKRKLGKWLGVTALFAFVPVLFDILILHSRNSEITLSALFSDSSTYLIGFGICASGFGDALYERKVVGVLDGLTIAAIIISALTLTVGAVLYAINKGPGASSEWGLPLVYVTTATLISFVTVLVTAR